ncbi:MAG: Na/Pi symporter [Cytophagales bacterium]|nr:Na/Pi symporter [Cytophagales bacterium]MDW8383203.1 Na/Pi symporter [Flammeovirgaceae bacterium]
MLLFVLGGLALFLFGINQLAEVVQSWAGENTRYWLLKFTKNTFLAILTGIWITTLLGSSSAVIILTIILAETRLLSVKQSLGIVLGANIGTTMSSQIIAIDIGRYAPILMIIGLIIGWISQKSTWKKGANTLLFLGILFFGLFVMEEGVEPLKNDKTFYEWLSKSQKPTIGTVVGAFVTLIIQSSSATVGMAIVLVKHSILSLKGGIAIMMGAELGTVADTLIATIGRSLRAFKVGIFHFLFNLISIITGLLLFDPFFNFVEWVSISSSPEKALANAHTLFNVLGVLLFGWTIEVAEKLGWLSERKTLHTDSLSIPESLSK